MRFSKILLSLVAVLAFFSCEDPIKDFNIHIAPTFYKYVVEIELSDVADPDEIFTGTVSIAITGEDADAIYGMDGKKEFKVNFGSIQLITSKADEPTASDPLRFNVEITSSDYRTETVSIEVNAEDYYVLREANLLNLSNLPSGINNKTANGAITSSGELSAPLVFDTDSSSNNPSQMQMTIPTGINFLDANGATLNGSDIEVSVLSFNDTTRASQMSLPNGTGALQTVNINGVDEVVLFDAGSTFEIDMSIGGAVVKGFTGSGVALSIPLPAHMYNNKFNRPYQVGDKISLVSFSSGDTKWADEGNYTVQQENGKLVVKPSITHLSTYKILTDLEYTLTKTASITFKNSTSRTTINKDILVTLNDKINLKYNVNLKPGGSMVNGLKISSVLNTIKIESSSGLPNADINVGSNGINVDFKDALNSIEVGYKLICKSSNAVVTPPSGVKMLYRETAVGGKYNYLYTFTGEDVGNKLHKISALKAGVYYDFRALFNENQVDTSNVLVIDKKIYEVTLPPSVCSKIGF